MAAVKQMVACAPVPWASLGPQSRAAGAKALRAVVEVLAGTTTSTSRRDLEVLATTLADKLALAPDDDWLIGVEHPAHTTRATIPKTRSSGVFAFASVDAEQEWCRGQLRWFPLREGFELLAGTSSPETDLERRRAELADRRKRVSDATAEREAKADEARAARAAWESVNHERIAAWDRLPPELQRMHVLCGRFPAHGDLLRAWIELSTTTALQPRGPDLAMPDSFAPELRRR
jgi:hypothetical protein